MKDFNDFTDYMKEHSREISYDVSRTVGPWLEENYPDSEFSVIADVMAKTSVESVKSILRQYHHWLFDNQDR